MATVVNRTTKEVLYSVNTPNYDPADWVINPDLSSVSGLDTRYWKITGDTISPMNASEREAVDASLSSQDKATKIEELKNTVDNFLPAQGYNIEHQQAIQSLYSEGLRLRANARNYLQPWVQWLHDITTELRNKIEQVQSEPSYTGIQGVEIDTTSLAASNPNTSRETGVSIDDSLTLDEFLDSNAAVTGMSGETGIIGPYYLIELLNHRKELYNDDENPLYTEGHTPILGESGAISSSNSRILNIENIHCKAGWHRQEITKSLYSRPRDLLIFYGYPNSFNSATHSWNNEQVAQEMSQYGLIALGDGLQTLLASGTHTGSDGASTLTDSTQSWTPDEFSGKKIVNITDGSSGSITGNTSTTVTATLSGGTDNDWDTGDVYRIANHEDYPNVVKIVDRIKLLNPSTLIFGYVSVDQSLSDFQDKSYDWNVLGIHGILMDEAGYDFGRTRSEFNDRVDYVHGLSSASICFANAWNTDHILGTANDVTYPNSTYNSSLAESNLTSSDWILLESFSINTSSYSGNDGYESRTDWEVRGVKAQNLRNTYNVNFCGVGIINNDNASGQDLFDFGFVSALMWSLEGWGTSDTFYGASSSAVTWWTRPDTHKMGNIWNLNSSVQQDVDDADVYHAYVEHAKLSLDFSSSAQSSTITTY